MPSPGEIDAVMKKKRNQHKALGHDRITARMLQELPRKKLVMKKLIFNAAFRLRHIPRQWKHAKVIAIPKPGKDLERPASYWPIALPSTVSKLFEKIFMVRLAEIVDNKKLIPDHQYGFRESYFKIEQVHRVGSAIRQSGKP